MSKQRLKAIILMANIKTSQLIDDISGKVSRSVFTKGRNGINVRKQVQGTNPRSATQVTQRANVTARARAWVALSDAQRLAWSQAAANFTRTSKMGNKYKMVGTTYFRQVNQVLSFIGQSTVSAPPVATSPTNLTSASVTTLSTTVLSIAFAASPVPTGEAVILEATRCLSPGLSSSPSSFRKVSIIAAAATTPNNAFSAYSALFGTPVVGQKVFFRMTPVNIVSGIKGTPTLFSKIVA